MGCVYCLTSPSGKKYVGLTIRSFEERFAQHKKDSKHKRLPLYNAFKAYGWENFKTEILFECEDFDLLCFLEKEFIYAFNSLTPNGYNCTMGGEGMEGFKFSQDSKNKIAENSKNNWKRPEYRAAQIESAKNRWKCEDFREKQSEGVRKLMADDNHKKKLSDRTKKAWASGVYDNKDISCFYGMNSKLNPEKVYEIRKLCDDGGNQRDIAKAFEISYQQVNAIYKRRRWKYLEER